MHNIVAKLTRFCLWLGNSLVEPGPRPVGLLPSCIAIPVRRMAYRHTMVAWHSRPLAWNIEGLSTFSTVVRAKTSAPAGVSLCNGCGVRWQNCDVNLPVRTTRTVSPLYCCRVIGHTVDYDCSIQMRVHHDRRRVASCLQYALDL